MMACRTILDGIGNAIGFACGGPKPKPCSAPGCTRRQTKACDFPVNRRPARYDTQQPSLPGVSQLVPGTCDAPLCDQHATSAGPDLDYCPPHARYVTDHSGE